MPFIGIDDGAKVFPEGVNDGVAVSCGECGGVMYPRGPFTDGTARHFFHKTRHADADDCERLGGESDVHRKLKSLAASGLHRAFAHKRHEYGLERRVPTPESPDTYYRDADGLIEFGRRDDQLGRGVVAEVQYRNEGKDIEATTRDYLAQGWSVCWLYPDDFASDRCKLDERGFRVRAQDAVWPDRVRPSHRWRGFTAGHEDLQQLRDADAPLTEAAARVVLPADWAGERQRAFWRETDWRTRFPNITADRGLADVQASLADPVVTLNAAPWLTEAMVVDAFDRGAARRGTVRDAVPPPSEWGGTLSVDVEREPASIRVGFPTAVPELHRDELWNIWNTYANGAFTVNRRLTANNADRRCSKCGDDAAFYLAEDGVFSGFLCHAHASEVNATDATRQDP